MSTLSKIIVSVRAPGRSGPASVPTSSRFNRSLYGLISVGNGVAVAPAVAPGVAVEPPVAVAVGDWPGVVGVDDSGTSVGMASVGSSLKEGDGSTSLRPGSSAVSTLLPITEM